MLKNIPKNTPKLAFDGQRVAAVSLLLLVLMLIAWLVISPLVSQTLALNDTKQSLIFRLQQYEKILAQKDAVMTSMATVKTQNDELDYFNNQSTDALASAEMQNVIKQTIVEARGELSSTQAIPVSAKDGFSTITVRVRMTGNSEVLRAVLYKIETSTPLIVIDQIDIRPMRGLRNPATNKIEPNNNLNINFQAVSFMRKPNE